MRLLFSVILATAAYANLCLHAEGVSGQVSVRDFFKYPDHWFYQISASGRFISYLRPAPPSNRLNIFVRPVGGSEADEKCVTSETGRDIPLSYFWKGDRFLIYWLDRNSDEIGHYYLVDLEKPAAMPTDLTDDKTLGICSIVSQLKKFDDEMLVLSNAQGRSRSDVYRFKIGNGQMTKVAEDPGNGIVKRWVADADGKVLAVITENVLETKLLTRQDNTSPFRCVLSSDFRHSIDRTIVQLSGEDDISTSAVVVLSTDKALGEKEVLYAPSSIRRDTSALVQIDLETGEELDKPLYENKDFDVNGMEVFKEHVNCADYMTCRNERYCWGVGKQIYDDIAVALTKQGHPSNEYVQVGTSDRDGNNFIVTVSSDVNPGDCFLFDSKKKTLTFLSERAPQLKGKLGPTECITYSTRDGRKIQGYLTKPVGYDGKTRLPLIVIPHEGPWFRNTWGLAARENWEIPFFASRGYAVLQMNFRGSIGYGSKFWEAGFKQWGQLMQRDVTDGVWWAINNKKIADPRRIAIVGESYGGYAAVAGITFPYTQDFQYKAAVDRAGETNLLAHAKTISRPQFWEMFGDPNKDQGILNQFSPALQADRIEVPLLVAHGINDPKVNIYQSDQLVGRLRSLNKSVQYLLFNEGHLFSNEENRVAYYQAVEAFLEDQLR